MTKKTDLKPVLVTTAHRGVFAGLIPTNQDLQAKSMPLLSARMAIYWGTTKGVLQLAESGPTSSSKISAIANVPMLHDITGIFEITEEAWQQWQKR